MSNLTIPLLSVSINGETVYPRLSEIPGQRHFLKNLSIFESIFNPVVSGNLILMDLYGSMLNYDFINKDLVIQFKLNDASPVKKFEGIITDFQVLVDDAIINQIPMNDLMKHRSISITFMNKKLYKANYEPVSFVSNIENIPSTPGPSEPSWLTS